MIRVTAVIVLCCLIAITVGQNYPENDIDDEEDAKDDCNKPVTKEENLFWACIRKHAHVGIL